MASWVLAGLVVLMLLAGPKLVAHDSAKEAAATPSPYATSSGSGSGGATTIDAKALFSDNCGSCHTLKAAGTTGIVGPNLDDLKPDAKTVEAAMKSGPGSMPEFGKTLKSDQLRAVAQFVASR
jgi:mono/diheme cytochrome c family protein